MIYLEWLLMTLHVFGSAKFMIKGLIGYGNAALFTAINFLGAHILLV